MKQARLIVALVAAVILLIIIAQNTAPTRTRLLFVTITMPRAVLLGAVMLVGYLLGVATPFLLRRAAGTPKNKA